MQIILKRIILFCLVFLIESDREHYISSIVIEFYFSDAVCVEMPTWVWSIVLIRLVIQTSSFSLLFNLLNFLCYTLQVLCHTWPFLLLTRDSAVIFSRDHVTRLKMTAESAEETFSMQHKKWSLVGLELIGGDCCHLQYVILWGFPHIQIARIQYII